MIRNLMRVILLFACIVLLLSFGQAQKRAVEAEGDGAVGKHAVFDDIRPAKLCR